MRPKWERLGRLLAERRARLDPRFATRKAFAQATGLNLGLLRDLENATRDTFTPPTLAAVEAAYKWTPGSIDAVLAGGDPVEVAPVTAVSAMALGSYSRATPIRPPTDTDIFGQIFNDGDVVTITETATVRRFPNWFTSELERRGADLTVVGAAVETLREMAAHYRSTLAELLLEAGLANLPELEIRPIEEPDDLAAFKKRAEHILADPRLSRGQRKDAEAYYKKLLTELEGKRRGPD